VSVGGGSFPTVRSRGSGALHPIGLRRPGFGHVLGPAFIAVVFMTTVACGRPGSPAATERGPSSASGRGPAPEAEVVPVTKVTDGDTIRVTYRGTDEPVRLIGVDTPEVPWYGAEGECFGIEAGAYATQRLSARMVDLVFDEDVRDRFGRLLAYVYLGDELFNLTLVQMGFATAHSVAPNTSMASAFRTAQVQARAAGRGLWSACPSS
jgi:micrococcal nuclease